MEFDQIREGGAGLRYGFVFGGDRVAFIKVGLGGDIFGYANKYLQIAHLLKEKYGFGAVVASNPEGKKSHREEDLAALAAFAREGGLSSPSYFFFGHSNGGIKGLELAAAGVPFRRMVLVNMPLMINFHKTKQYLSAIPHAEVTLVCGEGDPSYPYLPFLEGKYENLQILRVSGADHNFRGMLPEFIALSEHLGK